MNYLEDSLALLRDMIRIPSVTFEEDGVCSMISSRLDSWGVAHSRFGNNIVAVNRSDSKNAPTIAFDAHIDTVKAASDYTRDPFEPGDEPDVIWGLGSNDDGGSVVSAIAAYRHYLERSNPYNIVLTLSCEEERSGDNGAQLLYGKLVAEGVIPVPDIVVLGEPTGMNAATSERGLLVLDGEASGISGHAARSEGVNAIYGAIEDIAALKSHKFTKVSAAMGETRLNVTQINAGSAHNVIPDKCTFVVDVRPTDCYDMQELLDEIQGLCKSRLTPRSLKNRSSASPAEGPLPKTLTALGIGTFSSPTTSNWVRIPFPAVKMGPGESSRSHHADEHIFTSEIEQAIDIFSKFADCYYGNTLE